MATIIVKPPFVTGCEQYYQILFTAVKKAQEHFVAKPTDKYAPVYVDLKSIIEIEYEDKSNEKKTKKYKLHDLHYGPSKNGKWIDVDYTIWERLSITPPFRAMQVEMLKSNLFLIDESNYEKSFGVFIRLYRNCPEYPTQQLWHRYNIIPGLKAYNVQSTADKSSDDARKSANEDYINAEKAHNIITNTYARTVNANDNDNKLNIFNEYIALTEEHIDFANLRADNANKRAYDAEARAAISKNQIFRNNEFAFAEEQRNFAINEYNFVKHQQFCVNQCITKKNELNIQSVTDIEAGNSLTSSEATSVLKTVLNIGAAEHTVAEHTAAEYTAINLTNANV